MAGSIITSFLGALQASLTVLLTISYGVLAARFNILKASSSRDISKICVRLFLPALLITNVGAELHWGTAMRYVPVVVWSLLYTLLSMLLGWVLHRAFKFPAWTVAAICFNNTTALPLVLLQSLETAGILSDLTKNPGDSSSEALARAKSYLLVNAMIANSLTFAIGPKLLDDEESPDKHYEEQQKRLQSLEQAEERQARDGEQEHHRTESEDQHDHPVNNSGRTAEEQEEHVTETTTLLPNGIASLAKRVSEPVDEESSKYFGKLPRPVRTSLEFAASFLNAPLIGAIIAAIIGLVPQLHKLFFNAPDEGGYFKVWLTGSIKNIGELFAALQLVVVGAKLSTSLLKMKQGKSSGAMPTIPVLVIFVIRFILWPAVSISVIYAIAAKTSWLDDDPILWFVLMIMPTGPSATKLVSLADVSGSDEEEKMSIAKFLTLSYVVSPAICFAVVGSLKASLAVKNAD